MTDVKRRNNTSLSTVATCRPLPPSTNRAYRRPPRVSVASALAGLSVYTHLRAPVRVYLLNYRCATLQILFLVSYRIRVYVCLVFGDLREGPSSLLEARLRVGGFLRPRLIASATMSPKCFYVFRCVRLNVAFVRVLTFLAVTPNVATVPAL